MKKLYTLIVLLALILAVSGCRSIYRPQSGVSTTSIFPVQQPGTYTLRVGDGISVAGKSIKLISVESAAGLVTLYVDGEIIEFPITRQPKVSRNLEIQTIRVDYGRTPEDNTATIDIKTFQLGPDEYYLRASERRTIAGTEIEFEDLTKTDGLRITVGTQEYIVDLGQTVRALNLEITHKKAYDNAVKANRYAVVQIKPIA